jgi:hypothetical protein
VDADATLRVGPAQHPGLMRRRSREVAFEFPADPRIADFPERLGTSPPISRGPGIHRAR